MCEGLLSAWSEADRQDIDDEQLDATPTDPSASLARSDSQAAPVRIGAARGRRRTRLSMALEGQQELIAAQEKFESTMSGSAVRQGRGSIVPGSPFTPTINLASVQSSSRKLSDLLVSLHQSAPHPVLNQWLLMVC